MKENLLKKDSFDIRDLATIVKKETQTIRSWEKKNIIPKPRMSSRGQKEWREYSKEDLADTLEHILSYPWERKIIKNYNEIQYIIDYLRGKRDNLDGILGEDDGED